MTDYISIETEDTDCAGAVVYWSLEGTINIDEFEDAWDAAELDGEQMPALPALEACLHRGALRCAKKRNRQMIRPIKRGTSAFVTEYVSGSEEKPTLTETINARFRVVREKNAEPFIDIQPESDSEEDARIAEQIATEASQLGLTYTARDISKWLLDQLHQLHAIGLRSRGGIYFVPRDKLDHWRSMVAVIHSVSEHNIFEIPAMKTEDAVSAILHAVRTQADETFDELEAYLSGDVISTRGLNAAVRKVEETQAYLTHYISILGTQLPELEGRAETVLGGIQASRLILKEEK